MKKALHFPDIPIPLSNDEAVAHLLQNNLTKQQYVNIRLQNKERKADIYPTYNDVLIAKKECYPQGIITTEKGSKVPLQQLLDHTASRVLKIVTEIFKKYIEEGEYTLVYKWGMDGTSDQARYKQRFLETDLEDLAETR